VLAAVHVTHREGGFFASEFIHYIVVASLQERTGHKSTRTFKWKKNKKRLKCKKGKQAEIFSKKKKTHLRSNPRNRQRREWIEIAQSMFYNGDGGGAKHPLSADHT